MLIVILIISCYISVNFVFMVYIINIDLELYDILLDELFFYRNMYVEEEIGI